MYKHIANECIDAPGQKPSAQRSQLSQDKTEGLKLCVYSWKNENVTQRCGVYFLDNSRIAGLLKHYFSRPGGLNDSKCHSEQ